MLFSGEDNGVWILKNLEPQKNYSSAWDPLLVAPIMKMLNVGSNLDSDIHWFDELEEMT